MEFSVAEINFICIVKGDNREDTINNIFDASDNPFEEQSIKQAKAVLEEYGIELG